MDKAELKVDDIVSAMATVAYLNDDGATLLVGEGENWRHIRVPYSHVMSLIERPIPPETDAEKIARLERELEEKNADVLAAERAYDDLFAKFDILRGLKLPLPEPKQTWTPNGWDVSDLQVKPDAPWYPPQLEGYGPWIEGPPASYLSAGLFQALAPHERRDKVFTAFRGFLGGDRYQHCVAHCYKLGG
jgi:hypothetical protein